MSKTYLMNMGGKRVDAAGQETFDDLNPFSGEVFARVPGGRRKTGRVQINDQTVNYELQVPFGGLQRTGRTFP